MKKHTVRDFAKALYEVTKGLKEKQIPEVLDAYLRLVTESGMRSKLPSIIDEFASYAAMKEGTLPIHMSTKEGMDGKAKKRIEERFGEREIVESKDERIHGGFRLRDGDTIYDATIDTQLKKLAHHLTR